MGAAMDKCAVCGRWEHCDDTDRCEICRKGRVFRPGVELVPCSTNDGVLMVRVDANTLDCGQKKLPYPTYIGTINRKTRKINVWTPVASTPRGYRTAAKALLEEIESGYGELP